MTRRLPPPPFVGLALVALAGCFTRSGTIDCTTGRAYPAFSKPLSGGIDPFTLCCDNCPFACASAQCGAYTPYGGNLKHGGPMKFVPGCTSPPLAYAPAAVPAYVDALPPGVPFSGGYAPVPAPWPVRPGCPSPVVWTPPPATSPAAVPPAPAQ